MVATSPNEWSSTGHTAFKEGEIEGAFDALAGVAEIECVEVSSASCWRGVAD